jgi:RHS repeat-associated protein
MEMFSATRRRLTLLPLIAVTVLVLLPLEARPVPQRVQEATDLKECPLPGTCGSGDDPFVLSYTLELVDPFTTVAQAMPRFITLPRNTVVTFGASARGVRGALRFLWQGAEEKTRTDISSTATRSFQKPGTYMVTVAPELRTPGVAPKVLSDLGHSITIVVTKTTAQSVQVKIADPSESPGPIPVGMPISFHGATSPAGYEHLIQWSGGGEPQHGFGPEFSTKYLSHGRYSIAAGRHSALHLTVYGIQNVQYDSAFGNAILYGVPVTFQAETVPPGYSDLVSWRVETKHDMFTRATPSSGRGAAFTTSFQPSSSQPRFWAQVFADSHAALLTPDVPQSLSGEALIPPLDQLSKRVEELGYGDPRDGDAATNVQLATGQYYLRATDLSIPGRGMDFRFERAYRSRIRYNGPLGHNWDFNYNMRLVEELNFDGTPTGHIYFFSGLGRRDRFVRLPDGSFVSPPGYYTRLTKDPSTAAFTLRERDGTVYAFTAVHPTTHRASLLSITDRDQNGVSFSYDGIGNLILITDSLGRTIQLIYRIDGRLSHLLDFTGRLVTFGYDDANGDLTMVTSPSVPTGSTPNGNDFPGGKTTRYTYSSGSLDADLNHNLLTIRRPNEVAVYGPAAITNSYGANAGNPHELDRILSQSRGGLNVAAASRGIPAAGGIFNFFYEVLNPGGNPNDLALPRSRTTMVDRIGNVAVYEQNVQGSTLTYKEFTGRVDPALPRTTLLSLIPTNNPSFPPIPRLRSSDPAFFETSCGYNIDGEMTILTLPETNRVELTYDVSNTDRQQQGNLRAIRRVPDSTRGGDQSEIRTTITYEPIYNRIRTVCDPRGNDTTFVPPVEPGVLGCARYTTTSSFDYQEGCSFSAIGARVGRSAAEVQSLLTAAGMCATPLGDINGDALTSQVSGNVIRKVRPTVHLIAGSNQALLEGSTLQPIVELFAQNQFGQLVRKIDPEGNVHDYGYHPERDPDGDGQNINPLLNGTTGGYLKQMSRDTTSSSIRNSGTNPPPANIRHLYLYDSAGNVIREIDGRAIETRYMVNTLNQVVQIVRASAHGLAFAPDPPEPNALVDFQYLERFFFDFNDNLIRRQREDRGDTSNTGGFADETSAFDILDRVIEQTKEASVSDTLVTGHRYDASERRTTFIEPEGNFHSAVFDERDLVYQSTRGAGGPFGGIPSTTTRHYDRNRNIAEQVDAADTDGSSANSSTIGGVGDRTRHIFDGFDRNTSTVDSVGNQSVLQYDPMDFVVRTSRFGPVGGPSPTADGPSVLLRPVSSGGVLQASNLVTTNLLDPTSTSYDELGRPIQKDRSLFVNSIPTVRPPDVDDGATAVGKGDLTPGDTCAFPGFPVPPSGWLGCVSSRKEWDRLSRLTFTVEDDLDTSRHFYDGAGRLLKRLDPEGNTVEWAYDDADNLIETREVDVSQVPGLAAEVFLMTRYWDSLNRLERRVDNLGQTLDYRYDSRDNVVAKGDAEGPAGPSITRRAFANGALTANTTNLFGNVTRSYYDGVSRQVRQEAILTATGHGNGIHIGATIEGVKTTTPPPDVTQADDGLITILYSWDRNSRQITLRDDNGNETEYDYDNLNRKVMDTKGICRPPMLADSCDPPETIDYQLDPDSNLMQLSHGNGSITNCSYDAINRQTLCTMSPAVNVVGTTFVSTEWDGLSRITRGTDNNDPGDAGDDSVITFAYDSLNRQVEEVQQIGGMAPKAISSAWRADGLRTGLTYPNGRRVNATFDQLDRLTGLSDAGIITAIVDYDYLGRSRVVTRRFPQNGTRASYLDNTEAIDAGYDGIRRAVQLRHLRTDNALLAGFRYGYDRRNGKRREEKLHATLESELYGADSQSRLLSLQRGLLNATGDAVVTPSPHVPTHRTWSLDGAGNWPAVDSETRQHSSVNEIMQRSVPSTVFYLHDDSGNRIDDGTFTYAWDTQNRLRMVSRKSDGAVIATYSYDAEDRRIRKVVTNSGALNGTTFFYLDGEREIEERRSGDLLSQQYTYGWFIDEVLVLDRNLDGDGDATGPADQRLFYHQNSLSSVMALSNTAGNVVEGYIYEGYGRQSVVSAGSNGVIEFGGDDSFLLGGSSGFGNPFLFTARRADSETGLYYYRYRFYDPLTGRFVQRDPTGYKVGPNQYEYVYGNPILFQDPYGLQGWGSGGTPCPGGTSCPASPNCPGVAPPSKPLGPVTGPQAGGATAGAYEGLEWAFEGGDPNTILEPVFTAGAETAGLTFLGELAVGSSGAVATETAVVAGGTAMLAAGTFCVTYWGCSSFLDWTGYTDALSDLLTPVFMDIYGVEHPSTWYSPPPVDEPAPAEPETDGVGPENAQEPQSEEEPKPIEPD